MKIKERRIKDIEDLEVILLELPSQLKLNGLLGVNFLERFRATFDFDNQALVLRQQHPVEAPRTGKRLHGDI